MCKFCEGRKIHKVEIQDIVFNIQINNDEIIIRSKTEDSTSDIYIDINYCPMCSRKLSED